MRKLQHISNNQVLIAPEGSEVDNCRVLPVTVVLRKDGRFSVVSFWQPNEDELALLRRGAAVRLCVLGATQPPLSLSVDGDGRTEF